MINESLVKDAPRILVVDDVEDNRFVLRDIITQMGYQPILTESGAQALKMLSRVKPRLILLDIAMPEMDGYELCKIIKEDPENRDIPIIFISAYDEPDDIVKGFQIGGKDYITKPFIKEVVMARVGVHLEVYDTNQSLLQMNRQLKASVSEQLKQMEQEKKKVLYALLRVARENAYYDTKHMERLRHNCRVLAQAMQLSPLFEHVISDTYIDTIELAAPLCDLGNVAIPSDVLQKQGLLTDEERLIVQSHAEIGARILEDVKTTGDYNDFIQMSMDIARYHHENWDGTGYPHKISGDEIPLAAQIVAVAGEYCALTEKRSYRDSYSTEEALEIMKEEVNNKFNPDVFNIMLKIYRQLQ